MTEDTIIPDDPGQDIPYTAPIQFGVWMEKEYDSEPVPIQQINDIVYTRANIREEDDVWKADERVLTIEMYRSETEMSYSISSSQAEAIVIAAEYASSLLGGN